MGEDRSGTSRRVTVAEAAQLLGVTVEAVRGRIKRDTLAHEKASDGTVYVLLDADQARPVTDQPSDQSSDQRLIMERLENEIQFLREELARKDAILLNMTEAMKAIAPPVQEGEPPPPSEPLEDVREYAVTPTPQPGRVGPQPSVEAAQEHAEAPEMPEDEQQGRGPVRDAEGPQEGTEQPRRRSWWREFFGFE